MPNRRKKKSIQEENKRLQALCRYERQLQGQGIELIAGVDEVGVGPLAGPVVAAAVILPREARVVGIDDSKKLSHQRRLVLVEQIQDVALDWALGWVHHKDIDRLNILQASRQAMRRAVHGLKLKVEHLLVDARHIPGVAIAQTAVIHGDSLSQSIAAASILAKVERDAWMEQMAVKYPGYGFEHHRGYGTKKHMQALKVLGACPIHRRSFAPVRVAVAKSKRL